MVTYFEEEKENSKHAIHLFRFYFILITGGVTHPRQLASLQRNAFLKFSAEEAFDPTV